MNTTVVRDPICERVREMLHVLLEGEAKRSERLEVEAHLERCAACRRELERERSLSELLDAHFTARRAPGPIVATLRRLVPVTGVVSILIALSWLLPGPAAYGSIEPAHLLPSLAFERGARVPLGAHNHLVVGPQEARTIEITGVGTLRFVGPAVVELDRGDDGWKLVLLRGQVEIDLVPGGRLEVASVHGVRELEGGLHVARLYASWFGAPAGAAPAQDEGDSPGELLARAHRQCFGEKAYVAAEASYQAVRDHPDASADERRQAHFYQLAAVANQGRNEDALALGEEFLATYPEDESATYVLFFQGVYLERLGRIEEAHAAWREVVARDPAADLADHARRSLGEMPQSAPQSGPQTAPRTESPADVTGRARAIPPADEHEPRTLVVGLDLAGEDPDLARFRAVAGEVARFHEAERVELLSSELERIEAELRARLPDFVIFVLPPQSLDVRLHRRLLLCSARLDTDVFPDCAFGYLTASDGKELERMWDRTLAAHRRGLSSEQWRALFVTGSDRSITYPGYIPEIATAAGFEGEGYGIAVRENDAKCLDYVAEVLPKLGAAGVVTITGNGDPQGIWLFDDGRNVDDSKHWPYGAELVGNDPEGEMPRVLAADFAALELDRPVVWSGTCHSAATRRVWVEGDIVSTFGVTDGATLHELDLEESMGLSILRAGAVALLAPIAANHGYSVELEAQFALENGATLGETIKSTWDDVYLQAEGNLRLHFPEPGERHDYGAEPIMQGGGANRVLIGDPTLRPFGAVVDPGESVVVEKASPDGFEVLVDRKAGFRARAWDIYGTDSSRDHRVTARVRLDALLPEDAHSLSATLELTDANGASVPRAILRHVEIESFGGERFLHLQANAPRELIDRQDVRARFRVTIERGER